jgi:hypothetical protein
MKSGRNVGGLQHPSVGGQFREGAFMNKIGSTLFALALAAPLLAPNPSGAAGALAVGSTGNVIRDGISIGDGYNYSTTQGAIERALTECRKIGGSASRANCMIVGTFEGQCTATALDPGRGTPGAGWSIAEDTQTAENRALANCQATAGVGRRGYCKITMSHCDTHN